MHENSSPQAKFFNIWDAKIHYCKGNLAFRISKFSKISACGGLFSHHKVGKNSRFSHQGLKYGGKKSLFFPTRVPHYGGKKTLEFSFSHHYGGKKIPLPYPSFNSFAKHWLIPGPINKVLLLHSPYASNFNLKPIGIFQGIPLVC